MADITLKGNAISTIGDLPKIGSKAPSFTLTTVDLSHKSLLDFEGKNIIMNIFPSVDTGICAMSVREFNEKASGLENAVVLCISKDLPFAQARFCAAEGLDNVVMLSDFAKGDFGKDYKLNISNGPMADLHSRAIVIVNPEGIVTYTQQVPEIAEEPNYEAALKAI
jgi:thiol peroxidase